MSQEVPDFPWASPSPLISATALSLCPGLPHLFAHVWVPLGAGAEEALVSILALFPGSVAIHVTKQATLLGQ